MFRSALLVAAMLLGFLPNCEGPPIARLECQSQRDVSMPGAKPDVGGSLNPGDPDTVTFRRSCRVGLDDLWVGAVSEADKLTVFASRDDFETFGRTTIPFPSTIGGSRPGPYGHVDVLIDEASFVARVRSHSDGYTSALVVLIGRSVLVTAGEARVSNEQMTVVGPVDEPAASDLPVVWIDDWVFELAAVGEGVTEIGDATWRVHLDVTDATNGPDAEIGRTPSGRYFLGPISERPRPFPVPVAHDLALVEAAAGPAVLIRRGVLDCSYLGSTFTEWRTSTIFGTPNYSCLATPLELWLFDAEQGWHRIARP